MPIPEAIRSASRNPRFWAAYFWENGDDDGEGEREFSGLTPCRFEFPASGGHGLVLEMVGDFSEFRLHLRSPGSNDPVEVGWDDQAHFHPHVLRWDELDLIGRAIALAEPALVHPGLVVLLLCRFAPICIGDDSDVLFPLLEEAWAGLGLGTGSSFAIQERVDGLDRRPAGFTWQRREPRGWFLGQSEDDRISSGYWPYTLRHSEDGDFPFDDWDAMIEAARRACARSVREEWFTRDGGIVGRLAREAATTGNLDALPALADALERVGCDHPAILEACRRPDLPAQACWVVETLAGVEPGTAFRRRFGPVTRIPKARYSFEIEMPLHERGFSGDPAVRDLARSLHRSLTDNGLGAAGVSHGHGDHIVIAARVIEDRGRGLQIIQEEVARTPIPGKIRVFQTDPSRLEIPPEPSPDA